MAPERTRIRITDTTDVSIETTETLPAYTVTVSGALTYDSARCWIDNLLGDRNKISYLYSDFDGSHTFRVERK